MLYVTTRCDRDAFTAHRALFENRGPDGGLYLPFRTPKFSQEELDTLLDEPFSDCVADVLNLLFGTKITAWDVEYAIGRRPFALKNLGHRVMIAELWRNPDWQFQRTVQDLTRTLRGKDGQCGDWPRVAVGAAVLFGLFGELKQAGNSHDVDICGISGDFSMPMSAWYARQWGLPVGNIVCCCNENNGLWDLICHGQMRTDAVSTPTATPDADVTVPVGLERLVYQAGGVEEVRRYLDLCRQGRMYAPSDAVLAKLRQGIFVSVVSSQRVSSTISNFYRTTRYPLSPYTALCYGGLLDYRAKTGETRPCLLLAEKAPVCDRETVAKAIGVSEAEIEKMM